MKPIVIKLILTVAVLLFGFLIIEFVFDRDLIHEAGDIELIIMNEDQEVLFHEILPYEENESFFEILNERFTLTCANQFYQPDNTCSFTFNVMGQENHVILGIKSESFEIMTDWDNTFLNIEVYDGETYIDANQGFDMIQLENIDKIRILVDDAR
ncbi:hypothetical protein BK011_08785 [Tenericutes bacterium MZ-XQ]|nr:hypothetical protein BK011_08785 [Tenericutes bacterium MZ-XQ]